MESYILDWASLLLRWLHLIVGIAWIGSSFYFVWLDNTIKAPPPDSDLAKKGVMGELWAVHGGGFYNPQKYLVAPAELPKDLHWFKWEAYSTWLSGFALLVVVYYCNAQAMMIDQQVANLSSWQAIAISLGMLLLGWAVYDGLCRTKLGDKPLYLGITVYVLLVLAAYVLAHLFGGRAMYIHVGAMIGTIMVANVFMIIIPGQKKTVAQMLAGEAVNPAYGLRAKQRSVHNNYFTLPVLFIMISNHYAMTTQHPHNWAVLGLIMAAGVLIRHFFNLKHKGKIVWAYPAAGVAVLLLTAIWLAPKKIVMNSSNPANMAQVQAIMQARCVSCHAAVPTQAGFAAAPANVMLQTPAQITQHAEKIFKQTVTLKSMPLANLTQMTDEERNTIAQWFAASNGK